MMIDAGLDVPAFFTSRAGGTSVAPYDSLNLAVNVKDDLGAVADNRDIVSAHAGVPVSFLNAEHGIKVHHVTGPGASPPPADVLVASQPGIAIATLAADCVPVLIHDKSTGAVAAAHVGREGLFRGVLDATVAALLDFRAPGRYSDEMSASIGPAICGRCYEVPAAMRALVASRHPIAMSTTAWGTPALDLPRAVEARLGQLGFSQIVRRQVCTYEDPRYFSHRRDGLTGRCAGVIVCE